MEKEIKRVEMSENVADPTGLGLLGLAIVCFVVSTSRVGWSGPTTSVIVPWAVLLGSLAQLIASYFDFKKNNPFGSVVFGAYGLFWSAMAGVWLIPKETDKPADRRYKKQVKNENENSVG